MKYYFLKNNMDIDEIGRYPQCEEVNTIGTIRDLGPDGPIGTIDILPIPILHSRAKKTNYLDVTSISEVRFLIIDDKLLNTFKSFNIQSFEYWPIKIEYKSLLRNKYNLFRIIESTKNIISFDDSIFYTGKPADWRFKGKEFKVKNFEEFIEMQQNLNSAGLWLKADSIVIDTRYINLDLFRIDHLPFGKGHFVSETLKEELENRGFTGMTFIPIEEFHKKIKIIS